MSQEEMEKTKLQGYRQVTTTKSPERMNGRGSMIFLTTGSNVTEIKDLSKEGVELIGVTILNDGATKYGKKIEYILSTK